LHIDIGLDDSPFLIVQANWPVPSGAMLILHNIVSRGVAQAEAFTVDDTGMLRDPKARGAGGRAKCATTRTSV
jgi:hypothetical protein